MQSSKGLEFHSVYIPGLSQMPAADKDAANEARVLYVAMTRATGRLLLTASNGAAGGFVERINAAVSPCGGRGQSQ
jgi:superfamily I DNA/RNA helicase